MGRGWIAAIGFAAVACVVCIIAIAGMSSPAPNPGADSVSEEECAPITDGSAYRGSIFELAEDSPAAPGSAYVPLSPDEAARGQENRSIVDIAVGVLSEKGASRRVQEATFQVMLAESNIRNLRNPNVPRSMSLPNDGEGSDNYSVGVVQQQVGADGSDAFGWGTVAQAMDPAHAIRVLVEHLQEQEATVQGDASALAQAVQRSGFDDGSNYRAKAERARELLLDQGLAGIPSGEYAAPVCPPEGSESGGGPGAAESDVDLSAEDTLPWKTAPYCPINGSCPPGSVSPLSVYNRECVDFVLWKLNEMAGVRGEPWKITNACPECYEGRLGNARYWGAGWDAKGWPSGMEPRVGAVAWYDANQSVAGAMGHVAMVSEVRGDQVVLIEYNFLPADHVFNQRVAPASEVSRYLYVPDGWTEG